MTFVLDVTRGVYVMAPADASSRERAADCELSRHELPPGLAGTIEDVVRQASRTLGLDPAPRVRYLPADTPNVRGVTFDSYEIWVKAQPLPEMKLTALHELRHCWGLRNAEANYKSLGLYDMPGRQRDADDFAASWASPRYKAAAPALDTRAAEAGRFTGYASTWDLDQLNERFVPGAFAESLRKRAHRPLLWDHRMGEVVGVEVSIAEDRKGLLGTWRFADTQQGRDTRELVRSGAVVAMSVGFVPQETRPTKDGTTEIVKADLFECSLVSLPANLAATVTGVKSASDRLDVARELARRRSAARLRPMRMPT